MKAGFFQFRPKFGKISANLKTVVDGLANCEADLVVLPELPFTGYYFQKK
jgi:predicted amidohydrolase